MTSNDSGHASGSRSAAGKQAPCSRPTTRSSTQAACSRLWTGTPATQEKLSPLYDNQDISPDALSEEEPLDVALAEESYSRRRLLAEELKAP